jgi:quinol---cytochrome c reductase iron-sulfur subunit, bacillus type
MKNYSGNEAKNAIADGDRSGRRSFLTWAIGGISTSLGAILAWPMIGFLIGPIFRKSAVRFSLVAKIDQISAEGPIKLTFSLPEEDAFLRTSEKYAVWIVKESASKFVVFSPICPHLSCYINWNPAAKKFICPCHNSIFSETGAVLSGPAPRSLDTLPYKVIDGTLMVAWERFRAGVSDKIRI